MILFSYFRKKPLYGMKTDTVRLHLERLLLDTVHHERNLGKSADGRETVNNNKDSGTLLRFQSTPPESSQNLFGAGHTGPHLPSLLQITCVMSRAMFADTKPPGTA